MKKHLFYFIAFLCIYYNNTGEAQVFDTPKTGSTILSSDKNNDIKQSSNTSNIKNQTFNEKDNASSEDSLEINNNKKYNPLDLMTRDDEEISLPQDKETDETTKDQKTEDDENIFVPISEIGQQLGVPPIDGSQPGGQALVMVDKEGKMKKVTNIFLFYDEFKITHAFGNHTTCDVRFNIISTLDRKLSQIDVKLVWPDITTTLSFEDVPPYTQTYYNYTLMGDGCYSMDKFPNIIVNRCRAKGMTSSECANKIKWLSK